ncbi:nitric oxide reductase activation protein NorD [Massilia cavernae]|uniref:VWA domain-containing protein n=1 Tax=Massilia cavernae TaxID=2320864 RepID=A0A418Y7R7_9BURK|nr:VWA domain-containing protein [Massilia cavernae]RJG27124.1 VWA domain-containing protein [Massilia cavernae]
MDDFGPYVFLASAIAGRRVLVHVAMGDETCSYCDGQVIVVPRQPAGEGGEVWRTVVAQALLLAAGSLQPATMRRLIGRPQASRRYAFLEMLRALALIESRIPPAFARHPALNRRRPLTDSADESASVALSERALGEIPDFVGSVRPLAALRTSVAQDGFAALTRKQQAGNIERGDESPKLADEDEEDESDAISRLFNGPTNAGPVAKLFNQLLGMAQGRSSRENIPSDGAGSEVAIGQIERAWRRGVHAIRAVLPFGLPEFEIRGQSAGALYPEWDVHRQGYRKDWVCVDIVDPWRPDGPLDLGHVLEAPPRTLRRELSRLGLDYEMHRRQREGSEFDVGRLIDCAIDLAAGHTPAAQDVYRASRRTRRDLGTMVIVDVSGSTEEKNHRGVSVFDQHLRAAYQIAKTLDQLGDRVALYGFQSWGRKLVRLARLKGHEERWSGHVAERFAQLQPLGYTRSGAAIRHADRVLRTEMRLPNRLLILITDGFSYDQDYEGEYAEQDTCKALAEAKAAGTACVCVCIGGSQEAEKLKKVFGAANLLLVDDVDQIARRIRQVCAFALASVSQRKVRHSDASAVLEETASR